MLSKRAKELRKEINKNIGRVATFQQSQEMWNELLDNSTPTEKEFGKMSFGIVVSGADIYRLIVKLSAQQSVHPTGGRRGAFK